MGNALSFSRRLRRTPFSNRVEANGVKSYTIYNHMLLPTVFDTVEADYHHLKKHVQVWDVAVERQVEIVGPDAARLVQLMTPRNLEKMKNDQCFYVPVVDAEGGIVNDPIAIKLEDEHYWLSIADSDLLLFATGLATGFGLNVKVSEPDVSPLAVQGPKAETLMKRVFGDSVCDIRFFRHARLAFQDTSFIVARSGWSKQGGFEIYLDNPSYGEPLWDSLFEASEDLNVRAGCPNAIERIEGGLLSYGNDMTRENTPYECGLEKFCSPEGLKKCIASDALAHEAEHGPKRQLRGLLIDGIAVPACIDPWQVTCEKGDPIGQVTSAAWSPDLKSNIAIAMIDRPFWDTNTHVTVKTPDGIRGASVTPLPFI